LARGERSRGRAGGGPPGRPRRTTGWSPDRSPAGHGAPVTVRLAPLIGFSSPSAPAVTVAPWPRPVAV